MRLPEHIVWLLFLCVGVTAKYVTYQDLDGHPYTVNYDGRSFFINGERTLIQAGEIHYARSTPGMWGNIFTKARNNGLNAVQTYFFWNLHEHIQGNFNFSTPDLGTFLQLAAKNNLFIILRIGPYCDAEWNYGCYPVWLGQVDGINPRSNNTQWLALMRNVFDNVFKFVNPYLAKNGGPIIISQIENEYNGGDSAYLSWIANAVKTYGSYCPIWIMCQGESAAGTISTCDDCDCVEWVPYHQKQFPNQPLMNTEDHGFNQRWGLAPAYRTVEDLASGVAHWFAVGGTYHSYYMWHGGNNYARNAASGIATKYANDVLLYSDGVPHEPKYSHLTALHNILAWYSDVITGQEIPQPVQLQVSQGGKWQLGNVYLRKYGNETGLNFVISNINTMSVVQLQGNNITMPPNSVALVAANNTILWNSNIYQNNSQNYYYKSFRTSFGWSYWFEPLGETQPRVNGHNIPVLANASPLEQLKVTQDDSIYMWYRANITVSPPSLKSYISFTGRRANAYLIYIDGELYGYTQNYDHAAGNVPITLTLKTPRLNGTCLLEILSVTLGIDSSGGIEAKGIVSSVEFNGADVSGWVHQKGSAGEYLNVFAGGANSIPWNSNWTNAKNRSATWFATTFVVMDDIATFIDNPLLLKVIGLTRGHAYVNGMDIGLYWTLPGLCNYVPPAYGCQQGLIPGSCGLPTQSLYHIPPDWLVVGENMLVIFEDSGMTNLSDVSLIQKVVLD